MYQRHGRSQAHAAKKLVKTLKEEVGLPIHLHTHETLAGNQIASYCWPPRPGGYCGHAAFLLSLPCPASRSMNSLVYALQNGERDTGFDPAELQKLSNYWLMSANSTRNLKRISTPRRRRFTATKSPAASKYTNLKPQVESLGLGHRFDEVKEMFRTANLLLGNLIKVTPPPKWWVTWPSYGAERPDPGEHPGAGQDLTFPIRSSATLKG